MTNIFVLITTHFPPQGWEVGRFFYIIMKIKKTIIIILCLLFTGSIGYIFAVMRFGFSTAKTMFMLQEREIWQFGEAAKEAYFKEPSIIGIWALENYINVLNRVKLERSSSKKENPYFMLSPNRDIMISHTRIALLYKKMQNQSEYKVHIKEALLFFNNGNAIEEELLEFVRKLDEKTKNKLHEADGSE
ncbi:MAG: hypothetical protein ABH836_07390 [Candidatus Omnitrophota bacterium]